MTTAGRPLHFSPAAGISLVLLVTAFTAAYFPVWKGLVNLWWNSEDYSHGFVIAPLAAFIVWRNKNALVQAVQPGSWWGLPVILASLVVYLVALAGEIRTLASLSMIPLLAGAVLFLWGSAVLRLTLFPLALLLLMIPVPGQVLAAATIPLQLAVTKGAVAFGKLFGIPLLHQGNIIHLPTKSFEVVQACSGLRSIMTLVTLGAVLGYFTLNSNWKRLALLASSLPIAVVVNMLRVFAMFSLFYFFNLDLLEGTPHTILGLVLFVVTLGLFFLVQQGLQIWPRTKR